MTPGINSKRIDRETILPHENAEKKLELILDRKQKTGFWGKICPCFSNPKTIIFQKVLKRKTLDTALNILECLYSSYNQEMINKLWYKNVEKKSPKIELRDDLTYWSHIMMYLRS